MPKFMLSERQQRTIKNYRLTNCDIYVTLEPCPMCIGAIFNSRIKNLFFGAYDHKTGVCESVVNLGSFKNIESSLQYIWWNIRK